jgi:hypothetical protein
MNAILIAWVLSMVVCALFTFILPGWDALMRRRANQTVNRSHRIAPVSNVVGSKHSAV